MLTTILLSVALIVATIFVHLEALRATSLLLPYCGCSRRTRMFVVIIGIFTAHVIEIALYGITFLLLEHNVGVGTLGGVPGNSFMDYFYYSTVMYTSLGLGDVFPIGHLRVISGIETLNGLVLIGWSTSFTFLAMRNYWPLDRIDDE